MSGPFFCTLCDHALIDEDYPLECEDCGLFPLCDDCWTRHPCDEPESDDA